MVSVVRTSKFRHVFGEELQEKFEDIRSSTLSSESTLVKSNGKSVAVCWESGGAGVLAVFGMNELGRISATHPFIKGHTGTIGDFEFNPFNDNQILSGCEDGVIRLWEIPEGGLTADLNVPRVELRGHSKKVGLLNFHPTSAFVLASTSMDKTIKVWNIENAAPVLELRDIQEAVLSLNWSPIGRLLGYTTRDKYARAADPRSGQTVWETLAHDGSKPSKLGWIDEDTIVTCGFSKMSDRQIAVWDLRNPSRPLKHINVDQGSGVLYPFYDPDTKLLFVGGKGDGGVRYYEVVGDSQFMYYVERFTSTTPCKGISFIPKKRVDIGSCEIMRAVKLTNTTIDLISFKVPRRSDAFQDDIYPDCVSGEPALSASEWLSGENKEPKRAPIRSLESSPSKVVEMRAPKTILDYERELQEAHQTIKRQQQRITELEALLESTTKLE